MAAAKDVRLITPSEFGKATGSKKDSRRKVACGDDLLAPPSSFTISHEAKKSNIGNEDGSISKKVTFTTKDSTKNTDFFVSEEFRKIKETSASLINEIKKCKKQNAVLEEKLMKQMKEFVKGSNQEAKPAEIGSLVAKVPDVFAELKKSQEHSGLFHVSLQKHIEKQAETIEKLTGNYFDRQSELFSENENLRSKLFNLAEKHKEMKSHLEMQNQSMEDKNFDLLADLKESTKVIETMKQDILRDQQDFESSINEKQNTIIDLKNQLFRLVEENRTLTARSKEEINGITDKYNEEITDLRKELGAKLADVKSYKKKYKDLLSKEEKNSKLMDEKVNELKTENQKLLQQLNCAEDKCLKLTEQFDYDKTSSSMIVNELQNKCKNQEADHMSELKQVCQQYDKKIQNQEFVLEDQKASLKKLDDQLKNSVDEIEKLHAHISDMQQDSNVKTYEKEVEKLKHEKSQLSEACRSLESANELLNVRLLSLNNVVKIQEAEISKDGLAFAGEKTAALLNRWRDKVYALLVQLKSQQIMENEDLKNLQRKLTLYQEDANDSKNRVAILTNQLREKTAEAEMMSHKAEQVSKERDAIVKKETELEDATSTYRSCFGTFYQQLKSAVASMDTSAERYNKGVTSLKALESRLNFAKERLKTMEGLLARRDVLWRSKLCDASANGKGRNESVATGLSEIDKDVLLKEVQHLTEERQLLLNQIKEGTDQLSCIRQDLELEYRGEIEVRDRRVVELEKGMQMSESKNVAMEREVCELRETKKHIEDELETLKFDIQRNQTGFERALESKMDEERREYQDELARKDMTIDEARREHTKTIVSLKQIERQLAWQKQNASELITENNGIHQMEVDKLRKKIIELEKERNILLTTIKQENIKVPKMIPVGLDLFAESENRQVAERHSSRGKKKGKTSDVDEKLKKRKKQKTRDHDSNKLAGMLKELENLSNVLLEDDTAKMTFAKKNDMEQFLEIHEENSTSNEL